MEEDEIFFASMPDFQHVVNFSYNLGCSIEEEIQVKKVLCSLHDRFSEKATAIGTAHKTKDLKIQ